MFDWATKSDDVIALDVMRQQTRLESIRKPLEPVMDLVTRYFDQRLWDMMRSRQKGSAYGLCVYNFTAPEARRKFAGGFSSRTATKTDASQESWVNFVAPRQELREVDRVKKWLQRRARQVRIGFDRSTFYRETAYVAQISDAALLWGVMTIDADRQRSRLVFRRRDPRRHWFSCDMFGDIDVDHFRETMTAKTLVEQFEESRLPTKVVKQGKADGDKDPYTEYEVVQAIYTNGSRRSGSKNNLDKPFIQFYVLEAGDNGKDKTLLEKKGKDWRPSVLRIGQRLASGYPLTMAMDALTPAIQGDEISKHALIGSHALANPARLIHDSLRGQLINEPGHNLAPGSNTYYSTAEQKIEYLNQKIDPRYQEELLGRLDAQVKERFYINLFALLTTRALAGGQPATATQIRGEKREGIEQLIPVIQSAEDESLEPSVDAIWAFETELGNIDKDDIPQELVDLAQGKKVPIVSQFSGDLALLRRTLRQNQGDIEAVAIIKEFKEIAPSATVIVKNKKLLERMLVDRIGQDKIHNDRKIAEIEEGLAQIAQEERQLDQAERTAKIIPMLTKDAVDPESPAALAQTA